MKIVASLMYNEKSDHLKRIFYSQMYCRNKLIENGVKDVFVVKNTIVRKITRRRIMKSTTAFSMKIKFRITYKGKRLNF